MAFDAEQLKEIKDTATTAANAAVPTAVDEKLKAVFGVAAVDLGTIGAKLRPKVRDPEISNEGGWEITKTRPGFLGIPVPVEGRKTHRYTVDVPDEGEQTVLNLGHGDPV